MAKWSKSEKPWERQQGESAQAFEAFSAYLELGPDRSIRAVGQKLDKSRQQIGKWSSRWRWQERIRAYDNELLRQEFETEQKKCGSGKSAYPSSCKKRLLMPSKRLTHPS